MFIVWGRRVVRRPAGWVADFCPICRRPEVFGLVRVGSAAHVYYLSFGEGTLVGHEIQCRACGMTYATEMERYSGAIRTPRDRVTDVLEETQPRLYERHAQRLAVEDRLRTGSLAPDERARLIEEPFHLLEGSAPTDALESRLDAVGCLSIVGVFAAGIAAAVLGERPATRYVLPFALTLVGASVVFLVYALATAARRQMRKRVFPLLVRALQPLAPSREELARVLHQLKHVRGYAIAKVVDPEALAVALERAPVPHA